MMVSRHLVAINQWFYREELMATEDKQHQAEAPLNIDLQKLPLEEPEDGVFEAYANIVNMNWTLYDVRIRFGELIQVPDSDRPTWENQHGIVLERVAVTLPWHQAKYLRDILDGVIKNFEQINGELKSLKLAAPTPPSKI
jgi:hypothetical protein